MLHRPQFAPIFFRVFGCRIEIDLFFFAGLALVLLMDPTGTVCWCVAAAALHELGHMVAMRALGYVPCVLRLTVFGARLQHTGAVTQTYWKDFLVAVSGPLCNILSFSLLLAVGRCSAPQIWQAVRVPAYTHLAIGAFNLLPVEPLDGGQAVSALLHKLFPVEKADVIMNFITFFFLLPLGAAGFFVLLRSRGNYSLLALTFYLTALFVLKRR